MKFFKLPMWSAGERDTDAGGGASPRPSAAWWRGAVIYHIYPRSFADSNNDGVGDLAGVTERLDYVRSLGVDAVWLSPFYASPMRDFGYDISDYCAVDPIFGSLDDFDALVKRAHELGLRVIIDQVYSHTSDQHAWFEESRQSRTNPKADWYVWADAKPDGSPPSNWQSVFGGPAWRWDARRGQYYLHNFLPEQPDLNVHNPAVQKALLETARFWLDRNVDGFRLDAVNFMMHDPSLRDNPPAHRDKRTRPFDFQQHLYNQSHLNIPQFLTRVRQLVDSYGDRFLVAEVGGDNALEEMLLYTAGDDRLHSAYGFQYLYAEALEPALVKACTGSWQEAAGVGWPAWAFSNHDSVRALSRWTADRDETRTAKFLLSVLMALRGTVFVYQGEELGLPQADVPRHLLQDPEAIANWPLTLGRDGARTPMPWRAHAPNAGFSNASPWLPVDPRHYSLAVDAQDGDPNSILAAARSATALRSKYPVLRDGSLAFLDAPEPLLAIRRGEGEGAVLCVFNLGKTGVRWKLPSGWRVRERFAMEEGDFDVVPPLAGYLAEAR